MPYLYETSVDITWSKRIARKTKRYLKKHPVFVTDDFTEIMGDDVPHDLRHLGVVVRLLKKEGVIVETGQFTKVKAGTHYRPVYRSTIYVPKKVAA